MPTSALYSFVFGIAPIEIIYQIATRYILGDDNEIGEGLDTNFVCADSAEMAKSGTLADFDKPCLAK